MATRYGIYLSSTLKDLSPERNAVLEYLAEQAFSVKQSYSASETDLVESCLDDVAQCSVYIGIVGMRYGYTPAQGSGKSITEMEYELAQQKNIPCFVFLKAEDASTYRPIDLDSHTGENDSGASIRRFRERLGNGLEIRPGSFETTVDLTLAVAGKIAEFRRHIDGTSPLLQTRRRNAAELVHDVGLIFVPGTDDAVYRRWTALAGDSRFRLIQLSPDETAYAGRLDAETFRCRSVGWVLSPLSINRLKDSPQVLAAALQIHHFRFGATFAVLIDGARSDQLQPSWTFDGLVKTDSTQSDAEHLNAAYATIRAKASQIRPDRRISIPVMVLALTASEAEAMATNTKGVMSSFANADEAAMRIKQFNDMRKAIVRRFPAWPSGFYGAVREAWKPFGVDRPTAGDLLNRALERINDEDRRSSRERLLLAGENVKLHPRPYSFEEYLEDSFGSRSNLDRIRDLGCLLLVDELALLHPTLRERANEFLSGHRVAVMSANPCDPALIPVSELLDDLSYLRVGVLRERFRIAHDPRCELAINSVERMERWLRLILPELVPALGHLEPQADLRDKSNELFSPVPA